jgi:hypothetical protein
MKRIASLMLVFFAVVWWTLFIGAVLMLGWPLRYLGRRA